MDSSIVEVNGIRVDVSSPKISQYREWFARRLV
jgi:hypothetical protein